MNRSDLGQRERDFAESGRALRDLMADGLTTLNEKLIKICARGVGHARCVAFHTVEVAISKNLFADILGMIAELRPPTGASTA